MVHCRRSDIESPPQQPRPVGNVRLTCCSLRFTMLLSCFTAWTSFSLTLAVLTLLFICPLTRSHALWTYNVTWPDGNVTSFAFPRASHGDCLYDKDTDVLTCTRNHGYQSVVNTWTYDPELILYVSVRCLAPIPRLQLSSPACLCKQRKHSHPLPGKVKGGSRRGDESPSREGYDFCQLQQLSDGVLEDLEELQVLDLSHNLLQLLRAEAFRHLRELRVLSLKDNPRLHSLPEELTCELMSLEVLDVSHLPLQIFPAGAFHCGVNSSHVPSLRWLDTSGSRINAMPDHSLWNLGGLQFLNLSDNVLQHLPPHPLLGAISLTALDMSRNFLSSLPSDFCEVDSELRTLLLRENRFESLRLESLEECSSLVELDVSKNVISVLYGPPARLPLLLRLRLSHNHLQTLTTPLVTDNNSLNKLDVSGNQLKNIGNAVMDNLSALETLSLDGNALNELSVNLSCVFKQLANLKVLNLSNNLFQAISETDFSGLTSLQILDLSGNHISQVAFGFGSSLGQLRVLNLSGNLLTSVSPAAFAPLANLRQLCVSNNLLHHVQHLQLPAALLTFDLSRNFLHVVPIVGQGVPKLKDLHLAWNTISSLEDDSFGDLRSLESLDLSHNNLTSISPSSFQSLARLRALNLTHNKLTLNDSSVGQVFSGLRQLQQLNLSHNHITDVRPLFLASTLLALLELDLSFNPIGQIAYQLNPLNITRHLQHLLLRGCGLQEVSEEAFSGLIYLRAVSLQENLLARFPLFHAHPGVTFHLRGNPLACSCHMSWLTLPTVEERGQIISTSDYDVRVCRVAPRDFLRPVRDLQSRDFLCVAKSCHGNCTCYSQNETGNASDVVFCQASSSALKDLPSSARVVSFEGSSLQKVDTISGRNQSEMNVQELYLNGSGISVLSNSVFVSLSRLLTLDLGNNSLTELPPSLLAPLHNLTSLSLSHNQLTSLPEGLLSELLRLRVIDLSHNLLTTLTAGVTRSLRGMADLRVVRLGNNSWRCECDNAELYQWLKENAWLVPDRSDVLCAEDSGSDVAGRPVLSLNDNVFLCGDDNAGDKANVPIAAIVGVLLTAACLAALCACIYRYRHLLAAVLYARLGVLWVKAHRHETPLGCVHDVVVVFDHSDRKCRWWVERVLVPRLTNPSRPLRVHVPAIGEGGWGRHSSAHNSAREGAVWLVLVSKAFGAHHHAVASFRQALRETQGRPSGLVLITWGELTKQTLECGVRELVGSRQHLPVTAPLFWDRLLYLLPIPSALASRRRSLIAAFRFRSLSDFTCDESANTRTSESESQEGDLNHLRL